MKALLLEDCDFEIDVLALPIDDAYCDNMGVVKHGKLPSRPLSDIQVQSDIPGHIKYLLRVLSSRVKFIHIRAHMKRVGTET